MPTQVKKAKGPPLFVYLFIDYSAKSTMASRRSEAHHPPRTFRRKERVPFVADALFGRLEDRRDIFKTDVVHQQRERMQPDLPLAQVGVAVKAAPPRGLAVVEVPAEDVVRPDVPVDKRDEPLVGLRGTEVVTGGEHMAGVYTEGEARMPVQQLAYL